MTNRIGLTAPALYPLREVLFLLVPELPYTALTSRVFDWESHNRVNQTTKHNCAEKSRSKSGQIKESIQMAPWGGVEARVDQLVFGKNACGSRLMQLLLQRCLN